MTDTFYYDNALLALAWPTHDVNCKDPALMTCQQVIDEIADDGVRFVAKLGHDAANERVAAAVPFEIDRAVNIPRAMNLGPTVRAPGLFGPGFNKAEFFLQLRIARNLAAQRSAPGRDHLDHGLHL